MILSFENGTIASEDVTITIFTSYVIEVTVQ